MKQLFSRLHPPKVHIEVCGIHLVLPRLCLSPRHVKVRLISSMPSAGMKQQAFLVYTEPSTVRIGEAGFEQFSNVISFRVADAIFPRRMYFFCHGEMLVKSLLMAKNRDKYTLFPPKRYAHTSSYEGIKRQKKSSSYLWP